MPPNAQALRNHEVLFPGHVSTLALTDPELIEVFDNFAFDEVLRESSLNPQTRLIVQLAGIIGCQGLAEYRVMAGAALNVGVTPAQVREIVYQAVPYLGMARVFEFIHATNEVFAARGISQPIPGASRTNPATHAEQGLAVQKEIVGDGVIDRLYATTPRDQQHILHLLTANCFGDHLTRDALNLPTRELMTLSMLVALGGCEPQVKAHVQANLNVGNGRAVLIDVLTQLIPFIGYPRVLNGLRAIDNVVPLETTEPESQATVNSH